MVSVSLGFNEVRAFCDKNDDEGNTSDKNEFIIL